MIDIARLRGCGTALVTPFFSDGSIDEDALRRIIELQIEGGVHYLVACGTTGESVTLSHKEQTRVVQLTIEASAGRIPVVAGAGGYNTAEVVERIQKYESLGADAILSVTPYYNRPTQAGLYEHFKMIAQSTGLPIILYNVPGRTACNLEPATVSRLSEVDAVIGIKEASGNISQIADLASQVNDSFLIISGDDAMTVPVAALGGVGVISVASNLVPDRVSKLVNACLDGNFTLAAKLNRELMPLFKALFIESSPIPVKAAMAMKGLINEVYRLPLVSLGESNRARLREVLIASGVIDSTVSQAGA